MGEPTDRFRKYLGAIGSERAVLLGSVVSFNPGSDYRYRYGNVTAEELREYKELGSKAVKDGDKEICSTCFNVRRVCVCER